jgi:hypothetical protein
MNRQTLLEHIAKDKDVKATCSNISRGVDSKEFYQHIIYKICEIPEDRLLEIYNNNYLRWYIVRMIIIEWKLRHRNKKYLKTFDGLDFISGELYSNIVNLGGKDKNNIQEFINEEYNYELDIEVSKVEENINNLPSFEKRMLLEYIKSGSYRKLSDESGIPYRTIGNHVKRIKDKLK